MIGGNSKGLSHLSLGVKIPGPPFCRTICLAAIGRTNPLRTWCKEGQTTAALGVSLEAWPPTKSSPKIPEFQLPPDLTHTHLEKLLPQFWPFRNWGIVASCCDLPHGI